MNRKMASKRSEIQLAPLGRFIQNLYVSGGYATWKEFAEDAGISAPQVSDFKNATVEPSGLNLLKLIQAAAARGGGDAAVVAMGSAPPRNPIGEVAIGLASLELGQQEILRLLRSRREEEQSPEQGTSTAKRTQT